MSIELRGLDPIVRERAEYAMQIANYYGVRPIVTSGYRSWHEQAALRDRYLRGESRFPANAPGDSAHNYGWAWDSVLPQELQNNPAWADWWIAVRQYVGFEVPSNDTIHAQVPNWRAYR